MRDTRNISVALAVLGFVATIGGITASVVPTWVPSLGMATFFSLLAIGILALLSIALRKAPTSEVSKNSRESEITLSLQQLQEEVKTLQQGHSHLLEDKAFLQFLKADQERERQLVALDLHELVLPNLTSTLMHLEATIQRENVAEELIEPSIAMVRESLRQTRRIMNGLSPTLVHDEGVVASIQRLAEQLESSVATVTFQHDVDFDRLSPLRECVVVQLVRESLDQIRRRQTADTVHIKLYQEEEKLLLNISDDAPGSPFTEAEPIHDPHIRECVELLSGNLASHFEPDMGTILRIEFPLIDISPKVRPAENSAAFS